MLEKNNSYLEIANLSKSFGTFEAIKNILFIGIIVMI